VLLSRADVLAYDDYAGAARYASWVALRSGGPITSSAQEPEGAPSMSSLPYLGQTIGWKRLTGAVHGAGGSSPHVHPLTRVRPRRITVDVDSIPTENTARHLEEGHEISMSRLGSKA